MPGRAISEATSVEEMDTNILYSTYNPTEWFMKRMKGKPVELVNIQCGLESLLEDGNLKYVAGKEVDFDYNLLDKKGVAISSDRFTMKVESKSSSLKASKRQDEGDSNDDDSNNESENGSDWVTL